MGLSHDQLRRHRVARIFERALNPTHLKSIYWLQGSCLTLWRNGTSWAQTEIGLASRGKRDGIKLLGYSFSCNAQKTHKDDPGGSESDLSLRVKEVAPQATGKQRRGYSSHSCLAITLPVSFLLLVWHQTRTHLKTLSSDAFRISRKLSTTWIVDRGGEIVLHSNAIAVEN